MPRHWPAAVLVVCSLPCAVGLGVDASQDAVDPHKEMVWIPAGPVLLGAPDAYPNYEAPLHQVWVNGFWIDICEVTNAEYQKFIDSGGYRKAEYWLPEGWAWREANGYSGPKDWRQHRGVPGDPLLPASGVSWWEADAYCRWAGKRLPTEAEWEKAAKGGCEKRGDPTRCDAADNPFYPWGDDIDGERPKYMDEGLRPARATYNGRDDDYSPFPTGGPTPVGFYDGSKRNGRQTQDSPSPYGLYDVVGNVEEWCSTSWERYPYDSNDGRENPPATYDERSRVLRGGSWEDAAGSLELFCSSRDSDWPNSRDEHVGFRCAASDSAAPTQQRQ